MPNYVLEGPVWRTPVVTWSFAAKGGQFSDAIGAYQAAVQQAVALWDDAAAITLIQVDDTAAPDIRIGFSRFGGAAAQVGETNYAYNNVAQTFVPGVTVRIEDPAERPLGGDGSYAGTTTTLAQVALHEFGHALGLGHDADQASVMYPVAGPSNRAFDVADTDGIRALYGAPCFAMTDTSSATSKYSDGDAYAGPVAYLQRQLIYSGADGLAVASGAPNVFIHTGSGDDAISVASGQNVLDGGTGSNFLTGGTGNDTFFLDGRGGQVSWGTLVNFHAGDTATLWGYTAGLSSLSWVEAAGAAGYTGATLHAGLDGSGRITASLTFAGATLLDRAHFSISTGNVGGSPYLAITNQG